MIGMDPDCGQPLYLNLIRRVAERAPKRKAREAIVAAWTVMDLRRFTAKFGPEGQIETNLPINAAHATVQPVIITLLTMIGSPDGQPVAWAVVFWRNEGMWFKQTAPRYSDDRGLSVAQDTLKLHERLRRDSKISSELVIQERDVPSMIKDWLKGAYKDYLGSMMAG